MIRRDESNDILLDLDMEHATREQKIAWLCRIIKNETEKPIEDRDNDLIMECSEYLDELSGTDVVISEEELDAGLAEIKRKQYSDDENSHTADDEVLKDNIPSVRKFPKKRIGLIIAACFLALLIATPVVAYATGHDAFAIVSSWVKELFGMKPGETEVNGITIIKGSESKKYSTIAELLEGENLDIMYPTWLPETVEITKVWMSYQNETDFDLTITFSDENLSIIVNNYNQSDLSVLTNAEIQTINGIEYYIMRQDSGQYFAICKIDKYEYTIVYTSYDILTEIIQNMKGLY